MFFVYDFFVFVFLVFAFECEVFPFRDVVCGLAEAG